LKARHISGYMTLYLAYMLEAFVPFEVMQLVYNNS
jgi:hypothetical protein